MSTTAMQGMRISGRAAALRRHRPACLPACPVRQLSTRRRLIFFGSLQEWSHFRPTAISSSDECPDRAVSSANGAEGLMLPLHLRPMDVAAGPGTIFVRSAMAAASPSSTASETCSTTWLAIGSNLRGAAGVGLDAPALSSWHRLAMSGSVVAEPTLPAQQQLQQQQLATVSSVAAGKEFTLFLDSQAQRLFHAGLAWDLRSASPFLRRARLPGDGTVEIGTVYAGWNFAFAVTSCRRRVFAIGNNYYGQLGLGTSLDAFGGHLARWTEIPPQELPAAALEHGIEKISCGLGHSVMTVRPQAGSSSNPTEASGALVFTCGMGKHGQLMMTPGTDTEHVQTVSQSSSFRSIHRSSSSSHHMDASGSKVADAAAGALHSIVLLTREQFSDIDAVPTAQLVAEIGGVTVDTSARHPKHRRTAVHIPLLGAEQPCLLVPGSHHDLVLLRPAGPSAACARLLALQSNTDGQCGTGDRSVLPHGYANVSLDTASETAGGRAVVQEMAAGYSFSVLLLG